jgi:hypothetical protein
MAYATEITIGTGSKMSANYQSQDFNVSLTYQIEREDNDLVQLVEEKATEVETLHALIRGQILKLRTQADTETLNGKVPVNKEPTNGSSPNPINSVVPKKHAETAITKVQERAVSRLAETIGLPDEELKKLIACRYGRSTLSELSRHQGRMLITDLQRRMQRKSKGNETGSNSLNH